MPRPAIPVPRSVELVPDLPGEHVATLGRSARVQLVRGLLGVDPCRPVALERLECESLVLRRVLERREARPQVIVHPLDDRAEVARDVLEPTDGEPLAPGQQRSVEADPPLEKELECDVRPDERNAADGVGRAADQDERREAAAATCDDEPHGVGRVGHLHRGVLSHAEGMGGEPVGGLGIALDHRVGVASERLLGTPEPRDRHRQERSCADERLRAVQEVR
jgi:hypothetical protein